MKAKSKAADLSDKILEPAAEKQKQNWSKQNLSKYLFINISLVIMFEAILLGVLFLVTPNHFLQASSTEANSQVIDTYSILSLVNKERAVYDLNKLEINLKLQAAAETKAKDLINQQYFSHTSPTGKIFSAWIKSTGYDYYRVGENLAIFFKNNNKVVTAWMDSDKHRQNILNPYYTETGIAVIIKNHDDKNTQIVVQIFGQPTEFEKNSPPLILTLE